MTSKQQAADALEKGRDRLTKALVQLVLRHAFDAAIIMRLRRQEDTSMPFPMATDGVRLLVNPLELADHSIAEIVVIFKHEARHVAGLHSLRMEWRTQMAATADGTPVSLWNIACDAVVNDQLRSMEGLRLPAGCVPGVPDSTPEAEYAKLLKQSKQWPKLAVGAQGLGDLQAPKHPDGRPYNAQEKQELGEKTKQWVEAAAHAAKTAGQMDAGLERLVKNTLRSVVPWREVLSRFVAEKRAIDYSWQRPNKRHVGLGLYLPKMEAQDVPRVCIACDMSGSISEHMAREAVSEVLAVLELMAEGSGVSLPVLWFDHAVYPQDVEGVEDLRPQGGGGTSYAPVMAWVRKHADAHDVKGLIVVTDGHCGDFGKQPPCEVLWVMTNEHNESFAPPWGEVALVLGEQASC